jgi:hypothetical protein
MQFTLATSAGGRVSGESEVCQLIVIENEEDAGRRWNSLSGSSRHLPAHPKNGLALAVIE